MYNLIKQKQDITKQITNQKETLEKLKKDFKIIEQQQELLHLSKRYKLEYLKTSIIDLLNQALAIVFPFDLYEMKLESKENKYQLLLYKNKTLVATNHEIFNTTGGGVITVLSFVLKILFFITTNNRFYILDEVFSQISEEYRPNIAKLLRILVDSYGFTFLIISHEGLEEETVDLVYKLNARLDSNQVPELFIEHKQDFTNNNLQTYYVDIKNFQSIKDLTLEIKGITVLVGPSDIGKSAIQRAIRAIVINDFNTSLYPRKNRKRGELTKITLETSNHKISLSYGSDKVKYNINGTEYVGKRLSQESISHVLADMGFLAPSKELLSKFSGNLKKQLERVFITTQFDSVFFPEDRNGVEKILSILFNSQNFNEAIALTVKELQSVKSQFKKEFDKLNALKRQLGSIEILIQKKIFSDLQDIKRIQCDLKNITTKYNIFQQRQKIVSDLIDYYILLNNITQYSNLEYSIQEIHDKIHKVLEVSQILDNLVIKLQSLKKLQHIKTIELTIQNLDKKKGSHRIQILDNLQLLSTALLHMHKYISTKKQLQAIEHHQVELKIHLLKVIQNILALRKVFTSLYINIHEEYQKVVQLKILYRTLLIISKLHFIHSQLTIYTDSLENLVSKYNLQICPCCRGLGYKPQ